MLLQPLGIKQLGRISGVHPVAGRECFIETDACRFAAFPFDQ